MSTEELLRIKEKYMDYLLKLEGVTGVGVNGSIIIYVEQLTPELAGFLPKRLDGVPVRLIKTGKIVPLAIQSIPMAQAIYAERTGRFRPAPGGVSCGHPEITAGTLSCRAIGKQGNVYGLSNDHVIALDWGESHVGQKGDPILQPGPYDGGRDPIDKLGELDKWVPVKTGENNLVDAARFYSDELAEEIQEVGRPDNSIKDPIVGMKVLKSGRTSGVSFGQILDVNATMTVEGWGTCTFVDQITVTPAILSPGDSGSWIGEIDSFRTVGLGHAGSPDISVICKAAHVERLLEVEIVPPLGYISPFAVAGAWSLFGMVGLGLMPMKGA